MMLPGSCDVFCWKECLLIRWLSPLLYDIRSGELLPQCKRSNIWNVFSSRLRPGGDYPDLQCYNFNFQQQSWRSFKEKFVWFVALQWHQTSPPEFYLPVCDPSFICISKKCLFEQGEIKENAFPNATLATAAEFKDRFLKIFIFLSIMRACPFFAIMHCQLSK